MDELCPTCHPLEDPDHYVVSWCQWHVPDRSGQADAMVTVESNLEKYEGGLAGKAWCDLIHRGASGSA